jgi:hypothetical protein
MAGRLTALTNVAGMRWGLTGPLRPATLLGACWGSSERAAALLPPAPGSPLQERHGPALPPARAISAAPEDAMPADISPLPPLNNERGRS